MLRYASEVDVDFVRRSIKAIGQTAVKIDAGAERCVNVLLDLISTRISYVVQEAVVVMKVLICSIATSSGLINRRLGHLSKISSNLRRCHSNIVRQSRGIR
jgi:vesicle coat complex subunit